MFLRMLVRAAVLRRGRAAAALSAMVVAAAVTTAMLNLYVDVQAKLHTEFRNYGANVVVVAKEGQTLPSDGLQKIKSVVGDRSMAVPFAYVVARTADGQPVVVSGTDLEGVRNLNHWWSVTAWPNGAQDALVGVRAAALLAPRGQAFDLTFQGRAIRLQPAGTVRTGSSEDSRIYLSLKDFENWTGVQPSTVEVAASGRPEEVGATIQKLAQILPEADVRPVRQIMEGEARVFGKIRATLLVCAILIILTSAVCVLSTLMGWVFDRRRDFAIMKTLGASERLIGGFFITEAAALGTVGAVLGFVIGVAIAAWIGRVNFHAPVTPRFGVLPEVLVGSMAVALISALLPMSLLRRVQPATILRGE
jgi:putative ABC transport system permease protein